MQQARYEERIERAATWLKAAKPQTTEDRTFHLLGLHWVRADRELVNAAARVLIAEQRADGGWAQIPTLESDAYATGQALVALAESGAVPMSDRAWQHGVQLAEHAAGGRVLVRADARDSDSAAV